MGGQRTATGTTPGARPGGRSRHRRSKRLDERDGRPVCFHPSSCFQGRETPARSSRCDVARCRRCQPRRRHAVGRRLAQWRSIVRPVDSAPPCSLPPQRSAAREVTPDDRPRPRWSGRGPATVHHRSGRQGPQRNDNGSCLHCRSRTTRTCRLRDCICSYNRRTRYWSHSP
jgi:hypothetical protein